jgi:hypothetical protein
MKEVKMTFEEEVGEEGTTTSGVPADAIGSTRVSLAWLKDVGVTSPVDGGVALLSADGFTTGDWTILSSIMGADSGGGIGLEGAVTLGGVG